MRIVLPFLMLAACVGTKSDSDTGAGPDDTDSAVDIADSCLASGGALSTGLCCSGGDFPDSCSTGACGCSPDVSVEVQICACPSGSCFDGTSCVPN